MLTESSALGSRVRVHAALGDPARLAIVDALALGDASPGEIARAFGMSTNLVAHHVNVLQAVGVIARSRSGGDRRRTYLRLIPPTLATLFSPSLRAVSRVLFVCTHNSARSQLAAALWSRRSRVPVASGGMRPAARVHPRAVRVARRHGLSIDQAKPANIAAVVRHDDLVVAVCDNAHERLGPDLRRLHWSIPDPALADTDEAFEAAFTDIAGRIERLATVVASPPDPDTDGTRS